MEREEEGLGSLSGVQLCKLTVFLVRTSAALDRH